MVIVSSHGHSPSRFGLANNMAKDIVDTCHASVCPISYLQRHLNHKRKQIPKCVFGYEVDVQMHFKYNSHFRNIWLPGIKCKQRLLNDLGVGIHKQTNFGKAALFRIRQKDSVMVMKHAGNKKHNWCSCKVSIFYPAHHWSHKNTTLDRPITTAAERVSHLNSISILPAQIFG